MTVIMSKIHIVNAGSHADLDIDATLINCIGSQRSRIGGLNGFTPIIIIKLTVLLTDRMCSTAAVPNNPA